MSSLLINPHYCPEDKDILDFVNSISVTIEELTIFLRKRGVYVSKDAKKSDLANLLVKEIYSWNDVSDLLLLLDIPTQKEHYITGDHQSSGQFETIEDAVSRVKEHRLNKYGDRVTIESIDANTYRILIDYTQIDHEKTRLIQCVERDAEILIEKTPSGFKTRRSDCDRASEIELAILGEYESIVAEDAHELTSIRLKLSLLPTLEKRVQFFTDLMEGIAGFDFEQIKTARTQSYKDPSDVVELGTQDLLSEEYKPSLESLIFNGKNIGNSAIYDSVVGKDFFVSSAVWTAVSDSDECRKVEVKASFVPIQNDFELQFSVFGVWLFKSGEIQPKERPNQFQKARFANLLRDSAEQAIRKATT